MKIGNVVEKLHARGNANELRNERISRPICFVCDG
jgi:hypothetical protein